MVNIVMKPGTGGAGRTTRSSRALVGYRVLWLPLWGVSRVVWIWASSIYL